MSMHRSQNGSNDPVAGSTIPGAVECSWTRAYGIQSLGIFDKICTLYTSVQPHEASGG